MCLNLPSVIYAFVGTTLLLLFRKLSTNHPTTSPLSQLPGGKKKEPAQSYISFISFFFLFFVIYKAMINFQAKKPRQNFMSFHEHLSKISLHFMKIYQNFPSSIRQQLPKLSSFFQTSCLERLMVACICSLYTHTGLVAGSRTSHTG